MITSKDKLDFNLALAMMDCETQYGKMYWRKAKRNILAKRREDELQRARARTDG